MTAFETKVPPSFGSTCPSCGSNGAYISLLAIECRDPSCSRYTAKQRDAYVAWSTPRYVVAKDRDKPVVHRLTFDGALNLAIVRSQLTNMTDAYFRFTSNTNGVDCIVNIPFEFLILANIPKPAPTLHELGFLGSEFLAHTDDGLCVFDFIQYTWVKK